MGSITFTIEAATAAEAKQLAMDLAETLAGMKASDIPVDTKVSTLEAAPAAAVAPQASAYTPAPTAYYQQPPQPLPPVPQAPPAVPVTPPAPQQAQTAPGAVPTTQQSYSIDQLAVAATQLMDAGRQPELINLLQQFGVQALTSLPKEHYGAFATALRSMGAKI